MYELHADDAGEVTLHGDSAIRVGSEDSQQDWQLCATREVRMRIVDAG
jgi:hypothetical protein